jgi:hypothetical protein
LINKSISPVKTDNILGKRKRVKIGFTHLGQIRSDK